MISIKDNFFPSDQVEKYLDQIFEKSISNHQPLFDFDQQESTTAYHGNPHMRFDCWESSFLSYYIWSYIKHPTQDYKFVGDIDLELPVFREKLYINPGYVKRHMMDDEEAGFFSQTYNNADNWLRSQDFIDEKSIEVSYLVLQRYSWPGEGTLRDEYHKLASNRFVVPHVDDTITTIHLYESEPELEVSYSEEDGYQPVQDIAPTHLCMFGLESTEEFQKCWHRLKPKKFNYNKRYSVLFDSNFIA